MEISKIENKNSRKKSVQTNEGSLRSSLINLVSLQSDFKEKKKDINWCSRHESALITNKSIEKDKEIC